MEIRKLTDHPQFSFEGKSRLIRQCWNFVLKKGENTPSNLNTQGEEIHVIIAGQGRGTVGERSSEIREGGRLAEEIGGARGLDSEAGVPALERMEKGLVGAIVTTAARYRGAGPGFPPRRWR